MLACLRALLFAALHHGMALLFACSLVCVCGDTVCILLFPFPCTLSSQDRFPTPGLKKSNPSHDFQVDFVDIDMQIEDYSWGKSTTHLCRKATIYTCNAHVLCPARKMIVQDPREQVFEIYQNKTEHAMEINTNRPMVCFFHSVASLNLFRKSVIQFQTMQSLVLVPSQISCKPLSSVAEFVRGREERGL